MGSYKKHIIITGSARSGTSWLSETISQAFRYRLLFEPDHPDHVREASFLADRLLVNSDDTKEVNRFLERILGNAIDNDWIAQNSNRKYKMHLWPFLPKKYIIKLIRSNLAMHHISATYNIPIIHIIRNPYHVLFSQRRVRFPWLYDLSIFQSQYDVVALIKEKTGLDIRRKDFSELQILAIRWAIENIVPLKWQGDFVGQVEVVKYEDLKNDISVYKNLCSIFNLKVIPNIEEVYSKPSSKTHPKSEINRGGQDEVQQFYKIELEEINEVLKAFGGHFYQVKSEVS